MKGCLSVIMCDNFYFTGTIASNLKWKNPNYNEKAAYCLAERLNLKKEVPEFQTMGLESFIRYNSNQRPLSRKLAFMKAILKKSKIIILKDTPWVIGGVKITDIIKEEKLNSTVIGITNDLAGCQGAQRLVYLDKLKIIQDDKVENLHKDQLSLSGALLRSYSAQAYEFLQGEQDQSLQQVLKVNSLTRNLVKSILKMSKNSESDTAN